MSHSVDSCEHQFCALRLNDWRLNGIKLHHFLRISKTNLSRDLLVGPTAFRFVTYFHRPTHTLFPHKVRHQSYSHCTVSLTNRAYSRWTVSASIRLNYMVINGQQIYWECGRRRQFITSEHLLVKYVKKTGSCYVRRSASGKTVGRRAIGQRIWAPYLFTDQITDTCWAICSRIEKNNSKRCRIPALCGMAVSHYHRRHHHPFVVHPLQCERMCIS